MIGSGADLQVGEVRWQVRVRLPVGRLHPDRRMPLGGCPVAELAIEVPSPGVNVAVAAQGQRMPVSGADLQVGEVRWQVRVRLPVGRLHPDRRMPLDGCPVAEPAIGVVSPGVNVPVAAQGQGMKDSAADLHVGEVRWRVCRLPHFGRRTLVGVRPVAELAIAVVSPGVGVPVASHCQGIIVSAPDLVESDAPAGAVWRGDGGGLVAQLAALVGADAPLGVPACGRPVGGQGQVLADGPAEVVGDLAGEPPVEQEAFPRRVGVGALHPAVRGGDMLVCWHGASSACVEAGRERGSWLRSSCQRLVDRVPEAPGEGLAVLPARDENSCLSGLAGGHVRLPGAVAPGERQCLAVQAGRFQDGRLHGVEPGGLACLALPVQAPREDAALPADGGDPAAGLDGLHVLPAPVVRALGRFSGLPGPGMAVRADDHGLIVAAVDSADLRAAGQADRGHAGRAARQVPGLPVRVQEEEPLAEGLGLDDAHAWILLDACGLGVAGLACVPGPGLPVRVHDESLAGGGGGGDGLRLIEQAERGLLDKFWILAVGLAGLIGVDLSLPVHGQQPVVVHADAAELGVPAGVEEGGRRLSAGPGVDLLVGSDRGVQFAAGCNLLVVESVGSLGGGGHLFGRAVLCPCVDAAVAGQADGLVSGGIKAGELRFLPVGRADGHPGAGGGPMVRAQRPVHYLRPLGFQGRVLQDGGLEVERLAVKHPPIEPESGSLRILLRGSGEGAGFHGRLGWFAAVRRVEARCVRGLVICLVGWFGRSGDCAVRRSRRR